MEMIGDNSVLKLLEDLEDKELKSSSGILSVSDYAKLLALYIYQSDFNNANYLWDRIPSNLLSAEAQELIELWSLCRYIFSKLYVKVYAKIQNTEWSDEIREILLAAQEKIRKDVFNTISIVYSTIDLDSITQSTGLNKTEARQKCKELQWSETIDAETQKIFLNPIKQQPIVPVYDKTKDSRIHKTTDYILFLEN